jgi:hypothetical protein
MHSRDLLMRLLTTTSLVLVLAACESNEATGKETGGTNSTMSACDVSPEACDEDGDGYKPSEGDCDDNDSTVNPSAIETCNGRDDNCDGQIDEGVGSSWYEDADGDGFGDRSAGTTACEQPDGYVSNSTDCDDDDAQAFPGNPELCDGIDNNCDGVVDEGVTTTFYADSDGDSYGDPGSTASECEVPLGYVSDNTDCDDGTARAFPGNPEECDTIDNDCDGRVDEGVTTQYFADVDGDGYGDVLAPQDGCSLPTGYSANADDCDDTAASVNPAATEYCNGIDDDCDAVIDESDAADASTWYADADADSYGDAATATVSCTQPAGYVADGTDCDDTRDLSNPAATEYCNGFDDDCDGTIDEDDAADASTWYADVDADGFGNGAASDVSCYQPVGYVADSTDCDDSDVTSFPGGIEVCDGADNDCNGLVDDAPTDGTTYYADNDADGFGDVDNSVSECALPLGYVENAYDCDDSNSGEPTVADAAGGSSSGDGSSVAPFDSIQDAINAASQCVIAYPGTYTESVDLDGKSLDVWGVQGSALTTIDASLSTCSSSSPTACGAAVEIASGAGAAATLRGFTITGGSGSWSSVTTTETCADSSASHDGSNSCSVTTYTYCGGGIHVDGDDPTLEDIVVTGNTLPVVEQASTGDYSQSWLYSYGGGICVAGGIVTMTNSSVVSNYADTGGGIYVGAGGMLSLEQGIVGDNDASDGGGMAVSDATLTSNNSVWACNSASTDGGGVFLEGAATVALENTVLFGNSSSTSGSARGADVWGSSSSSFTLLNSIVENNIATALLYGTGSATLTYNDVYNGSGSGSSYGGSWAAGAGSISVGSNFVGAACDGNPWNDDWSLTGASTAIDGGDPAAAYMDVDGSANDMGAYGGPGGDW